MLWLCHWLYYYNCIARLVNGPLIVLDVWEQFPVVKYVFDINSECLNGLNDFFYSIRLVVRWVIPLGDVKDYVTGRYYRLLARDPDTEDVGQIIPN